MFKKNICTKASPKCTINVQDILRQHDQIWSSGLPKSQVNRFIPFQFASCLLQFPQMRIAITIQDTKLTIK